MLCFSLFTNTLHLLLIAPTGPPQSVEVVVINSTSVKMTWSSPLEQDTNGILRHFVINITKNTGGTQLVTLSAEHLSFTARDLQPYTSYYISIAAVTVAIGPFSGEITVEMPEAGELKYLCILSMNICHFCLQLQYYHQEMYQFMF